MSQPSRRVKGTVGRPTTQVSGVSSKRFLRQDKNRAFEAGKQKHTDFNKISSFDLADGNLKFGDQFTVAIGYMLYMMIPALPLATLMLGVYLNKSLY